MITSATGVAAPTQSRRARQPASAAPQRALGQFALLVGLEDSSSMPKQPAHLVALEKTQAARALRSNTSQGRDSCCNLLPVNTGTACMRYQS